jgi:hypothetical protein
MEVKLTKEQLEAIDFHFWDFTRHDDALARQITQPVRDVFQSEGGCLTIHGDEVEVYLPLSAGQRLGYILSAPLIEIVDSAIHEMIEFERDWPDLLRKLKAALLTSLEKVDKLIAEIDPEAPA